MHPLFFALIASCLSIQVNCIPASPPTYGSRSRSIPLSNSWSGWSNIQNVFTFGDSYTSTGFNINGTQPSRENPLGNPVYPGDTTVGSPDWSSYLTALYNASFVKLYNLAQPGGTIDDTIDPSPFGALSFRQQVAQLYLPKYANGKGGWTAADSIFMIWFGVNDVMLTNAKSNASAYIDALTESYVGQAEKLYSSGARNFMFLNIPAVDRVPLGPTNTTLRVGKSTITLNLRLTPAESAHLKLYIERFNTAMQTMTGVFRQLYPDATVWLFDTNTLFNRVLDNAASYPISSAISETKRYCPPYAPSSDTKLYKPECGVSRDKYFWADGLHPTSTLHELVAQQVVQAMERARGGGDVVALV